MPRWPTCARRSPLPRHVGCRGRAASFLDARRADEHGDAARAWLRQPDPLVLELLELDAQAVGPALARLAEQGLAE